MTIRYIQYFGQRRTGSSWLSRVIKASCKVEVGEKFGLKHDKDCNLTAGDVNETLFLFINRDIYMWLDALHKHPWGIEDSRDLSLKDFIRSEWYNKIPSDVHKWFPDCKLSVGTEVLDYSGGLLVPGRFDTPIHMRNSKIKSWNKIKASVPYAENISYVECIKDLTKYIGNIFNKYDIESSIANGTSGILQKDKYDYFVNQEYIKKYDEEDLQFIRDNCNLDIEKQIGFIL